MYFPDYSRNSQLFTIVDKNKFRHLQEGTFLHSTSSQFRIEHHNLVCLLISQRSIIPIVDSVEVGDDNRRSSVKLTKLTVLQDGATRFPKLAECAHFHYEFVDFGKLEVGFEES